MLPIKLSTESQREQVVSHLLSLSEEDRRLRFGYIPNDERIRRYVEDTWYTAGHRWFGIYNPHADGVIAVMHVAKIDDVSVEFGFTVDKNFRRNGYGNSLFSRGVTWAKSIGAKKVFMHCLSENKAVREIAKKNEMDVVMMFGGEAEADLKLPVDITAPWSDMMLDRLAIYDMLLNNQQRLLNTTIGLTQ